MKQLNKYRLLLFICSTSFGIDQYYCTAADEKYFDKLINLIGSIHSTNFENLREIAVFDIGLSEIQIEQLKKIQKIAVHNIELVHPDLLKQVHSGWIGSGKNKYVPGWYAWKPVALRQSLEMFPYVLWLDAGSTVLNPLDILFKHIKANDYLLLTIGNELISGRYKNSVAWQSTKHLVEKFDLNNVNLKWILQQEAIMSGIIGASKSAKDIFVGELSEYAKDLTNFEDDGSTPNGFGDCRHDQSLLTVVAYTKGLRVLRQDPTQKSPIYLNIDNKEVPFYVTWDPRHINHKTHIYNSRNDLREYFKSHIRFINE